MLLRIRDMAVDKFRIHFLYLTEKRLSLKACVFSGKQMAFVYLAFFDNGTAFPYLPALPRDFLPLCGFPEKTNYL